MAAYLVTNSLGATINSLGSPCAYGVPAFNQFGTASASLLFGVINQIATFLTNPVYGEVALLLAAIVLIRLLPQGITGRYFRSSL